MIKKNWKTMILTSLVILLPILAGLMLWDQLPDQMPTHWGPNGQPDAWGSKLEAVVLLPAILLGIHWLCAAVTGLDPKKENHGKKPTQLVLWICPSLALILGAISLATGLGVEVDMNMVMPLVMGFLMMVLGNYMPKCAPNYTIGIKIPWTLDSEANWVATHRMAGWVWMLGGFGMLFCAFLPGVWPVIACFTIMTVMVLIPVVYSWHFYKKEQTEK